MLPLDVLKDALKFPFLDKKTFLKVMPFATIMIFIFQFNCEINAGYLNGLLVLIAFAIILLLGGFSFRLIQSGLYVSDKMPKFSLGNLKRGFVIFIAIGFLYYGIIHVYISPFTADGSLFNINLDIINWLWLILAIVFLGRYAYIGDCWKALRLSKMWNDIKDIGILNMIIHSLIISIVITIALAPINIFLLIGLVYEISTKIIIIEVFLFILHMLLSTILFIYLFRSIGLIYSNVRKKTDNIGMEDVEKETKP